MGTTLATESPPEEPQIAVREAFRAALRTLPAAVSIITTRCGDERHGIAATAVCSVSFDPPSLLVCLNRGSTLYEPLTLQDRFGVSVLMASQAEIAAQFGVSASRAARFSVGHWDDVGGVPLLRGAQASFLCRRAHHTPFGTHDIVIGTIEEVVSRSRIDPLVYLDGGFASVAPCGEKRSRR